MPSQRVNQTQKYKKVQNTKIRTIGIKNVWVLAKAFIGHKFTTLDILLVSKNNENKLTKYLL